MTLENTNKVEAEMAKKIDKKRNNFMEKSVEELRKASVFRQRYADELKKKSTVKLMILSSVTFYDILSHILRFFLTPKSGYDNISSIQN